MNDTTIGSQITKFRKAANITQEELGRAVGVSTQAVSRWECGGAPDVSLLPAIADRLGVTIDALFGREGGQAADIQDTLDRWFLSLPKERRLEDLCRAMWRTTQNAHVMSGDMGHMDYLDTCRMVSTVGGEETILRTAIALDEGLLLGVGAEDMAFMSVFPEPREGYAAFFADSGDYRRLFAVLARPSALETLYYLYSEKERFYTAGAVARQVGLELTEAEPLLAAMEEAHLLHREILELEDGPVNAYILYDDMKILIPFLYFARWLGSGSNNYYIAWGERKKPILRKSDEK